MFRGPQGSTVRRKGGSPAVTRRARCCQHYSPVSVGLANDREDLGLEKQKGVLLFGPPKRSNPETEVRSQAPQKKERNTMRAVSDFSVAASRLTLASASVRCLVCRVLVCTDCPSPASWLCAEVQTCRPVVLSTSSARRSVLRWLWVWRVSLNPEERKAEGESC